MTAGDIKGSEVVVTTVTYGATVTVGQLLHLESDGKWDPTADGDKGKFAVALDAGADTETGRVVLLGRVDVTSGTTSTIPKGACVMAGAAGTVVETDHGAVGENAGTAMEAITGNGIGTVYVGLVE